MESSNERDYMLKGFNKRLKAIEEALAGGSGVDGWRTVYWTSGGVVSGGVGSPGAVNDVAIEVDSLDQSYPEPSWNLVDGDSGDSTVVLPVGIYLVIFHANVSANINQYGLGSLPSYDPTRKFRPTTEGTRHTLVMRSNATPIGAVVDLVDGEADYNAYFATTLIKL